MPLMPKRTKYRKQQKGRNRGKASITLENIGKDTDAKSWETILSPGML